MTIKPAKTKKSFAVTCAVAASLISATAFADPVEITQGEGRGNGYSFRRGDSCYVVTAEHVVPQGGVPIGVADRTAARAEGTRIFADKATDLALIQLAKGSSVACSESWSDPAWMRSRRFTPADELQIINHSSTGKETIYLFRYAGGSTRELELAPKDKMRVKQTDSGSAVFFGEQFAGVLNAVQTEDDRVVVLRADVIDDKVGEVLRGRGQVEQVLLLQAVQYNGRAIEDWTAYARSELAGAGVGSVMTGAPSPDLMACGIEARVLDLTQKSEPNTAYQSAVDSHKAMCGRDRGGFAKLMCSTYEQQMRSLPRTVTIWTVEVDVSVGPLNRTQTAQLGSYRFQSDPTVAPQVAQRSMVGKAVAATAKQLVTAGACN